MSAPAYRVDDRSVLLPHYTRFFIAPAMSRIPARLAPNVLTHAGHLCCLAAALVLVLGGATAWTFVASAVFVQGYVWFDNADGAHARRTKQTSTTGEYLDHGLDLLNSAYGGVTGMYSLGLANTALGVTGTAAVCLVAAITAWEQWETGTYRLGAVNQIESMAVVSSVLLLDAVFGIELQRSEHFFGVSLQYWLTSLAVGSASVTVLGSLFRVARARKSLVPALGVLGLSAAVSFGVARSLIPVVLAYATCATCTVAFGIRAFRARVCRVPLGPLASYGFAAAAVVVLASIVAHAPAALTSASAFALTLVAAGHGLIDALAIARKAAANDG